MAPSDIESTAFRLFAGVFGVIATLAAIVGAAHGLILGFVGIAEANVWLIAIGIATLLSIAGLFGAWFRIAKKYQSMTSVQVNCIRVCLYCGVVASLFLAIGTLLLPRADNQTISAFEIVVALIFVAFASFGVVFIKSTPQRF